MRELFNEFVTLICVGGLSLTALAMFVLATFPTAAEKVGKPLAQAVKNRRISVLIPIICVCAGVAYGTIKNNSGTNGPAPQMMSMRLMAIGEATSPSLQNEDVSNSFRSDEDVASPGELSLVENWCHRGAWQSGHILTFDADWTFPYATNHLTRVEIWSTGVVYPSEQDPTPIVQLATPLAIKPMETRVLCGRTTNNTYRIEWQGAYPNRDTTQIADAAIELHRNGDVIVTEGGITSDIPYAIPFAHDGFGQDEDWVRANFTNAEEILSVGYANWVDAQVGVGLTNGLYKFTATFEDYPLEATQLYVGDYSVCVTNAGEYTFVLEKGTEYEFGTWPYDDAVEYHAQDDLAADAPMLMSWWGGWDSPGEWTVDGDWSWIDYPTAGYSGWCCWMPKLQGSPNVPHLGPTSFPISFEALLSDYCGSREPWYQWSSSTEAIEFASPNARTTTAICSSLPEWDSCTLTVQANIGSYSLWSSLYASYGTNEEPHASFSMNAPEIVFLNDDGRTSRWYAVSLKLSCPVETNATISIANVGPTGMQFSADPTGSSAFSPDDIRLCVSEEAASTTFYCSCANLGSGTLTASCTLPSGDVLLANTEYRVIEPLRKLVSTVTADDGGYVNPSRLVYGTNAWLEVDQNGNFPASDIAWRVVSGPGEIVTANRYRACVRATAPSGTVVVEAAFGLDALLQPRFILPIVQKRRVAVKAFAVADSDGSLTVTEGVVDGKLEDVNDIYCQVGIEFYRNDPVCVITNSSYLVIEEHALATNGQGRVRQSPYPSAQVTNLVNCVQSSSGDPAEINLVWVNDIVRGTPIAFTLSSEHVCIFAKNYHQASSCVCAHEIGHALGLNDVYNARKKTNDPLPEGGLPLCAEVFSDQSIDWVGDDGRGFYEKNDTQRETIELLLMHGRDTGGCDIPSGSVRGFSSQSRNMFDIRHVPVGASSIQ